MTEQPEHTPEQPWTKEPWKVERHPKAPVYGDSRIYVGEAIEDYECIAEVEKAADAARIVACVDFCAGVENERIEDIGNRGLNLENLISANEALHSILEEQTKLLLDAGITNPGALKGAVGFLEECAEKEWSQPGGSTLDIRVREILDSLRAEPKD